MAELTMLQTLRTALLFPVLAVLSPAQGIATFPSDHAPLANGQGWDGQFPYSFGVSRIIVLYETWDLAVPGGHQITRIGFRSEPGMLSYGRSLFLEVRMGRTTRDTADLITSSFDANYLGPPTTVFGPAMFTLPDLNNVLNPNPSGQYVWLDLTTPYTFDANVNLLVEWRVAANSNGGASFTYALDGAAFVSPITSGPPGCQHSGGQIPVLASLPTKVGGTWANTLSAAPANQLAFLLVNVGTPLLSPFSLAPFGVQAACTGQVTPSGLFSLSAVSSPYGSNYWYVPVPNDRTLNDLILSSQVFCLDFFSPGAFVVSNGEQVQIGIDPAMSLLVAQGSSAAAMPTSVYGHYGIVTLFDYN